MTNVRRLPLLLTVIWLIMPIAFSGCATPKSPPDGEIEPALAAIAPPVPPVPAMEPVAFAPVDDGLWLSADDYRRLARNVTALREYAVRLEIVVDFYVEEQRACGKRQGPINRQ